MPHALYARQSHAMESYRLHINNNMRQNADCNIEQQKETFNAILRVSASHLEFHRLTVVDYEVIVPGLTEIIPLSCGDSILFNLTV